MRIKLDAFGGVFPKLPATALPEDASTVCLNARLDKGTLRAWNSPKEVDSNFRQRPRALHIYGHRRFYFPRCCETAEWTTSCPRLYSTGLLPYPAVARLDCKDGDFLKWQRWGVPTPPHAPIVSPQQSIENGEGVIQTSYLYTYQNEFCEEGAPSQPTPFIKTQDGAAIEISGFEMPAPEWNITHIVLYRFQPVFSSGGKPQKMVHGGDYFQVAKIPVSAKSYVDMRPSRNLGSALTSRCWLHPEKNLQGLIAVPNSMIFAAFCENQLWFTDYGRPWSWNPIHMLQFDDNIRAIRADWQGFIQVLTDGNPYTVDADNGCDEKKKPRLAHRHYQSMPLIANRWQKGAITTEDGVIFVTADGLALMKGNAAPMIITAKWFESDDWRKLMPETMRLGYYKGYLFCTSENISFMLHTNSGSWREEEALGMSYLSLSPEAYISDRQGEMFMLMRNKLLHWNAGGYKLPWLWRSRSIYDFPLQNQRGVPMRYRVKREGWASFSVGRFNCEGNITFTLEGSASLSNEPHEIFSRTIEAAEFMIPRHGRQKQYFVKLSGTGDIWEGTLASSRQELAI